MSGNKSGGKYLLIFYAVIFAILVFAKFYDKEPSVNPYEVLQASRVPARLAVEAEEIRRERNNEQPLTEAEVAEITDPITINAINRLRAEKESR